MSTDDGLPPNSMKLFPPECVLMPIDLAAEVLEGEDRCRCEQAIAQGLSGRCIAQLKRGEPVEFVEVCDEVDDDEDEEDDGGKE